MGRFPFIGETVTLNYEDGGWASGPTKTNPVANDLIADTGQLNAGIYDVHFTIGSTVETHNVGYYHRNAADDASIGFGRIFFSAHGYRTFHLYGVKVAQNERFTMMVIANITGVLQGSIYHVRRLSLWAP